MKTDKNLSRFWLENENDVILRRFGKSWLSLPVGKDRSLPAEKLMTTMSEAEFLKASQPIT